MNTMEDLTTVFRNVFEDDEIVLTNETTSNDIDGWDSLSHVVLIIAIENHFNIKFTTKELLTFNNVGDLLGGIIRRITE